MRERASSRSWYRCPLTLDSSVGNSSMVSRLRQQDVMIAGNYNLIMVPELTRPLKSRNVASRA
jgi:hypothetical protein